MNGLDIACVAELLAYEFTAEHALANCDVRFDSVNRDVKDYRFVQVLELGTQLNEILAPVDIAVAHHDTRNTREYPPEHIAERTFVVSKVRLTIYLHSDNPDSP